MTGRQIGEVKWFDSKKGFGVIDCDKKEYFIHHSQIKVSDNSVRKMLFESEKVEFEIFTDSKNKLCADNLTGIDNKKLMCETRYNATKNERKPHRNNRPKNTENFNPTDKPATMRVVNSTYDNTNTEFTTRDVILMPADLFCEESDLTIYNSLLEEMKNIPDNDKLWKLWHGDTHHIADDHLNWKKDCPTFNKVLDTIQNHFNMDIKATRFNWYKNPSEWKPFHFDAAAVDPKKSKTQNFTVGISFGAERDISFQVASNQKEHERAVVSFPLKNGQGYAFCRDLNTLWRHGVPQTKIQQECGRISIIAWGWIDQTELN